MPRESRALVARGAVEAGAPAGDAAPPDGSEKSTFGNRNYSDTRCRTCLEPMTASAQRTSLHSVDKLCH